MWRAAAGVLALLAVIGAFGLFWHRAAPPELAAPAPAESLELEGLKGQLAERQREIMRLGAENAELQGSVAALTGLNEQLTRDNRALNEALEPLQRRIEELTAELDRARETARAERAPSPRLMGVDTALLP